MKGLVKTGIAIVAVSGILGMSAAPAFALNPQPEPPKPQLVSVFKPNLITGWQYLNPQPEPPRPSSLLGR